MKKPTIQKDSNRNEGGDQSSVPPGKAAGVLRWETRLQKETLPHTALWWIEIRMSLLSSVMVYLK